MTERSTRRRFLAGTGSATALLLAGCSGGGGGGGDSDGEMTDGEMTDGEMTDGEMTEPVTVTVRIENVASADVYAGDSHTGGGVWVTPGAYAVYTGDNPVHTPGEAASVGLEALAEAGPPTGFPDEPGLVEELGEMEGDTGVTATGAYTPEDTVADPNDPMGEVPGAPPIAPGGAFEFEVEARPGQRLAFASMFVPSNDVFVAPGPGGVSVWPTDGEPVEGDVTEAVDLWDAGTEPNGQPGAGPDQAPAQDSPDQGGDEGGVVRRLSEVDDGYDYPAVDEVVRVTLAPGSTDGTDGEA